MNWWRTTGPARTQRPKWLWSLAVMAGAVGLGWYLNRAGYDESLYQSAPVARGELTQFVTASGQLNPVTKVEVGSQISGSIEKLFVDFNSPVKEGLVIAQLDAATYQANLIQAQGNLANAKAALELAQLNAERAKAMQAERLNPKADYDKALADWHQAQATVTINEGALKKAQVDLARCTIYSPIDGIVISRNVNVGQTVAASLSAPVLFLIANDLAKMQIEAQIAEADIGSVDVGQRAEFTVDAFPNRRFHGQVAQIRNAPNIEQNVVTYTTIIEVTNADMKLKPGMTANVSIVIAHRDDVLRIPNGALRFQPSEYSKAKSNESASDDAGQASKSAPKSSTEKPRKDKKEKQKSERTVYVLANEGGKDSALKPVKIKVGISDSFYTEVLVGLKEGDRAVIGEVVAQARRTVNPFVASRKK